MAQVCTAGVDTGFVALGPLKSAFLGVVQGVTELMPISSTAHMRIVPALLGWRDPGSAYSAAMQLAALAAVLTYFWRDVSQLATRSASALARGRFDDRQLRLAVWIVIATVPIMLGGVLLSKLLNTCNSPLRGVAVIGWACIGMAALLALAEIFAKHLRKIENVTFFDALAVGVAQAGALIPGVSRSGSTLTAALALGFNREEAARFSFLLGIPAIAGAGALEIWKLHKAHIGAYGWEVLIVGLVVASISAFAAIWGLMRIMERFAAWPFVAYRAVLGVGLLVAARMGWIT
ncbi:MAG: undecaprenyl-diphosphate phosphatase [Caulobacterales bacterium]